MVGVVGAWGVRRFFMTVLVPYDPLSLTRSPTESTEILEVYELKDKRE